MTKQDLIKEVNARFPGLPRLIEAGYDEIYMYLDIVISSDDRTELDQLPDLVKYLGWSDPDPDLIMGPPSRVYQALSDLFRLAARLEWDVEADEASEQDP